MVSGPTSCIKSIETNMVYEGKLISEITYLQRAQKYTEQEHTHEWQVKYYLHLMEQADMEGTTGVLDYTRMRETKEVLLSQAVRDNLEEALPKIEQLVNSETCPPRLEKKSLCRKCSYFDFSRSGERILFSL